MKRLSPSLANLLEQRGSTCRCSHDPPTCPAASAAFRASDGSGQPGTSVKLLFAALILGASVRHQLAVRSGTTPSTDALCPFGGVETLVTWITTGNFISKTHISNLILFAAVVVATVMVGNAFCGWVCPFGALQDALSWLRRTLHLPAFEPSHRVDRVLRWGRFVTLGVILYFSISTAKLWFAGWDPYVNLFGLGWLLLVPATIEPILGKLRQVGLRQGAQIGRDFDPVEEGGLRGGIGG